MLFETANQPIVFLCLFFGGFLFGIFAVILRFFQIKNKFLKWLEDFLMAILFCLVFFAINLWQNDGAFRIFAVISYVFGYLISKSLKNFLIKPNKKEG